jgi:4-amino-4-deoxy-L-arabinose transferase-like glycosyltransferase
VTRSGENLYEPTSGSAVRTLRWLLALIGLTLVLVPRWSLPLLDPEETRYAEIPREMLHHEQWLIPLYDGQPYLDKPPLLYWLVMVSYKLVGINTTAARLPANLIALLMVTLTYLWGKRERNQEYGLVAAGMLILMPAFDHYSTMLTMNGLLGFCVVAALMFGHSALRRELFSKELWCLSAIATGLGLLAKGPVALALVAVPLFVLPWFSTDLTKPRLKAILGFLVLAGAIAAPWYALAFWKIPSFGSYFFLRHHLERFVTPFDHSEPFWYYIPLVLAGTLPWAGIALSWLASGAKDWKKVRSLSTNGYLLASALWMLVFFSASGTKRLMYLVPIYPVLSLALTGYLLDQLASKKKLLRLNAPALKLVTGLMAVGLLAWSWLMLPRYHQRFSVDDVVIQSVQAESLRIEHLFCYPHPFSSVSFLLDRNDVQTFGLDQAEMLYQALEKQLQTVIFVKQALVAEFCQHLPNGLECSILSHNSRVSAILVKNKRAFASRQ